MKRRLPPKPKEPPEGFMYWHGRLMRVDAVEGIAKRIMKGFDDLPPHTRAAINEVPVWPHKAAVEFARRGDAGAAASILHSHSEHHFKRKR